MRIAVVIPTSRPLEQVAPLFSALGKQIRPADQVLCVQQYLRTSQEHTAYREQLDKFQKVHNCTLDLISPQNSRLQYQGGVSQVRNV